MSMHSCYLCGRITYTERKESERDLEKNKGL